MGVIGGEGVGIPSDIGEEKGVCEGGFSRNPSRCQASSTLYNCGGVGEGEGICGAEEDSKNLFVLKLLGLNEMA